MFWKKKAGPKEAACRRLADDIIAAAAPLRDALRGAAKDQQAAPTAADTDANHAAHVRSLARQLNAAIRSAEAAGLQVRTRTDGNELIDGSYYTAAVVVRIFRPI